MNRRCTSTNTVFVAALFSLGLSAPAGAEEVWLSIRLAALPAQMELCRQLNDISQAQLMIDDNGLYEWDVSLPNGPTLYLYTDTYSTANCSSNLRDATQVFAAVSYPNTPLPVVVDVPNATVSARIDTLLNPANLTAQSRIGLRSWGIYSVDSRWAYAGEATSVPTGANLPVDAFAPAGDVMGDCSATQSLTHPYCALLDVVGVGLANQPTAPKETVAAFAIGPGITGSWYDPNQSGHGLAIEVLPGNNLLAYWFTFDPDGSQQAWFLGVGNYSGNVATISQVDEPQGGRWIPNFDPLEITYRPWGTLTFTFNDCNHGRVDFASTVPGFGSGHMDLTRLTMPAGLSCP